MRPFPLSVQLYSLREEAKKNFIGVLEQVAAIGYQGVEFTGLHGLSPSDIRRVLDDLGLKVSSAHAGLPTAENKNQVIDNALTLGYAWHICGRRPDGYASLDDTLRSADLFATAAELLEGSGVKFAIHNHDFEFNKEFDGKTPHQVVMQRVPELYAQLDTYWIKTAGQNPAQVIAEYGHRARLLHIKDGPCVRGQAMTAVGDGTMVWEPIVAAAEMADAEWFIVEIDNCDTDMTEAVRKSRDYLVEKGYAK